MGKSNSERYEAMTQDEIMAVARKFDAARRVRAVEQIAAYSVSVDGAIANTATGEIYHCEDVRRWERASGLVTVAFYGCDCPDEQDRIRPLRAMMDAKGCGTPCFCKHHYLRVLSTGQSLNVNGLKVRAKKAGK